MSVNNTSVFDTRVKKVVKMAFDVQNTKVLRDENKTILVSNLGTSLCAHLSEAYGENILAESDIDSEVVDRIFTVKEIAGVKFTLVDTEALTTISKDNVIGIIYNLENLHKFLAIDSSVNDKEVEPTKVSVETSAPKQELIPAGESNLPVTVSEADATINDNVMTQYLMNEVMQSVSGNAIATLTLMQKKQEGKLTKEALMKIATATSGMGFRNNPMANMMLMQTLNSI